MKKPGFDSRSLLAAIVESSNDAIISKNLKSIVTSWNQGAERIFGFTAEEMIGQSIYKIIPDSRSNEEKDIIGKVLLGERINHYETVRRRKDGKLIDVSISVSPLQNRNGVIAGVSVIARDITEWKIMTQVQKHLIIELSHRSKNMLAIADSIVRQTIRNTPKEFLAERISRRFHALSINQDLLIEMDWRPVDIVRVIDTQVSAFDVGLQSRIRRSGPSVVLSPATSQTLGLAIHELMANALAFGALSTDGGVVDVSWQLEDTESGKLFKIVWQERLGPSVSAPTESGFGNVIMRDMMERTLNGKVSIDCDGEGFRWQFMTHATNLTVN